MTPSTGPAAHSVAVIVPCLNEAASLPYVFSRMPGDVHEVLLVDGGSTDGSVEVARELCPSVRVIRQTRRGKGNALACGFAAATSDILITVDADGSADPAEIPRFVTALLAGAQFAKGTRFAAGGSSDDITRLRRSGNSALTALVNRLYDTDFTDLCYGYNAFWRSTLSSYRLPDVTVEPGAPALLPGDGFEIETLIVVRAAAAGLRIAEVPSHEAHRLHGASNLRTFIDGRRVLSTILHEWRYGRRSRVRGEAPVSPTVEPAVHIPAQRTIITTVTSVTTVTPDSIGERALSVASEQ